MDTPMHVLAVEDTPIAQKVIKIQMMQQGCTVDIAADGATALEMALHTHYHLILMDIGLGPGPNGFEVTTQIKQQSVINKNTPIIAVTAHEEPGYYTRAMECGMVGYFNKPFTPAEAKIVIEAVENLTNK